VDPAAADIHWLQFFTRGPGGTLTIDNLGAANPWYDTLCVADGTGFEDLPGGLVRAAPITWQADVYPVAFSNNAWRVWQGVSWGWKTDRAPLRVRAANAQGLEGNSGTTVLTFPVTLDGPADDTVTVDYSTADGTGSAAATTADNDYQAKSGTITFNPGETSKTITILVNGDNKYEQNETFFVNLSNPTNAEIADDQGVGTIVNDDPVNHTPVANNFSTTAGLGASVKLDALAHASDADGDPLALTIVTGPSLGSASVNDNGTPNGLTDDYINYSSTVAGTDTLVYQVNDGVGGVATGTITITVKQGAPTISLTDNGGTYNGTAYPATATVAGVIPGVDDTPGPTLEGVGLQLTYYVGTTVNGSPLSGAPVAAGTYTVQASFPGSTNYSSVATYLTVVITPALLSVTATAQNKIYDSTTAATATLTLNGVVAGDTVSAAYSSAVFDNKNVGTGKTVTVSGISLNGADSGNYTVASTATTTANITKRDLTVSATGVNKVYDGTTTATVNLSDNKIAGDSVTDSYTSAAFNNKNVGTGKTVTVNGISISGADAGNYNLLNTSATTTADITAKLVTVTAAAQNKVYDGITSAMVSLTANGIVAGDMVMVTYTAANFDTPNVGVNKTVTVTGISLSGFSAGNYSLQNTTATTTADITSSGGGNSPPIAVNDSDVTAMDTPVTINVLANDWDPNGDPLTIVSAGPAPHGNVQVNNNGTVTYTPYGGMGYQGVDSFQYQISDGHGGTATATVTVTVGQPQFFAGAEIATDSGSLMAEQLRPVVTEAIGQLRAAGFDVAGLGQASFQITNLQGTLLGVTYQNTIWIDENAAGHGWYTGGVSGGLVSDRMASGEWAIDTNSRVDLLTVVTHELGHMLGFASINPAVKPDDWMTATLPVSVRRLPDQPSPRQRFVANPFGELPASMFQLVPAADWTSPTSWALSVATNQPPSKLTLLDAPESARDWYFASATFEESNSVEGSLIGEGWIAIFDSDVASDVVGALKSESNADPMP
jgi:hypothetical protein